MISKPRKKLTKSRSRKNPENIANTWNKFLLEKDKLKKEVAENENYIIFYLREYEINKMNDEQILQYIKNQIYKKD